MRIRRAVNAFIGRHAMAWEVAFGVLAVVYVALGYAEALVPEALTPDVARIDLALTGVFVGEYAIRIVCAMDRRVYARDHILDLVALLPVIRPLRALRLLRLLRLARLASKVVDATGLDIPLLRRLRWHLTRFSMSFDRRLLRAAGNVILVLVGIAAAVVTAVEKPWTLESFGDSIYWAINTVLGSGDPSYVASPVGWLFSWGLIALGLSLLAVVTGLLVSFIVNYLLAEGHGMGASGYTDHIVICGWNASARELIDELQEGDTRRGLVLIHPIERNPAGPGAYFINGDPTERDDLVRAGIERASVALIFPSDGTDDADMRSILVVLAIEALAPQVRTIAEVNNPKHVEHFRRAHVDEVVVPSQIGAHVVARSALYPGVSSLVAEIVAGGEGNELYRIPVPAPYEALSFDDAAQRFRHDHGAMLLAIAREGRNHVNPPTAFTLQAGDEALVLSEAPIVVARA